MRTNPSANPRCGVRKIRWRRRRRIHPSPHRRVADGVAPVDDALLDDRLQPLETCLQVREQDGLLRRAWERVLRVVVADVRANAPVGATPVTRLERSDDLTLAEAPHL